MVNGQGENKDVMSLDFPMVMVKWVGKEWGKWVLVGRPGHGREAKQREF